MKVYILELSKDKKNWRVLEIYETYELANNHLRNIDGYRRIQEIEVKKV